MTRQNLLTVSNIMSLLCGIWFLLLGWFWAYMASLFVAWPIGIIGLLLWLPGRNEDTRLNKIAGYVLLAGAVTSIVSFVIIFLFN